MRTHRTALLAVLATLATLTPAFAHEKWFCDHNTLRELQRQPPPPTFAAGSPALLGAGAAVLLGIGALLALDVVLRRRAAGAGLCRRLLAMRAGVPPAIGIATGLVFIHAGLNGTLFAPDLLIPAGTPAAFRTGVAAGQVAFGAALVLGLATRAVAAALLVLWLPAAALFGFRAWVDYVDVIGIGIFLLLAGRGRASLDAALRLRWLEYPGAERWAQPILRVFLGLNFAVLGINDKALSPAIALKLVRERGLNFMAGAGMSDETFVLCAAAVEVGVGLALLAGIAVRPLAAVLLALLTLTVFVFGAAELFGHLPLFAGAFALLAMGTGGRWSPARSLAGPSPAVTEALPQPAALPA